jgi:hypothetical protein
MAAATATGRTWTEWWFGVPVKEVAKVSDLVRERRQRDHTVIFASPRSDPTDRIDLSSAVAGQMHTIGALSIELPGRAGMPEWVTVRLLVGGALVCEWNAPSGPLWHDSHVPVGITTEPVTLEVSGWRGGKADAMYRVTATGAVLRTAGLNDVKRVCVRDQPLFFSPPCELTNVPFFAPTL